MKVVFWSPVHGQSGMTSNLLIISLICGALYKKKCLITQTHFNYNNLEAPLVEKNSNSASEYFMDVGIDALIRNFKAEKLEKELVENCCISLNNTNVSLLPGTTKINRDSFDFEIGNIAPKIFNEIGKFYDIIFIDANPNRNELSLKLMDEADLIVVNLSQNIGVTNLYLNDFNEHILGKKFYLFGSYDGNSKFNISNIRRKYKDINVKNSGAIPYNTVYKDAQIDSNVVEFVKKNINCSKMNENFYFITQSISAAEKILRMLGEKIMTGKEI